MYRNRFPLEEPPRDSSAFLYGAPFLAFAGASLFVLVAGSLAWAGVTAERSEAASGELEDVAEVPQILGNEPSGLKAVRAKFLAEISAALGKAKINNETSQSDLGSSWIRFSGQDFQFAQGSAALTERSARAMDKVAKVVAEAAQCLGKSTTERKNHNVFLGSLSSFPCLKTAKNKKLFTCSEDFKTLDVESFLIDGHADTTPYTVANQRSLSIDKFRDNLDLSSGRAETVLRRFYTCSPELTQANNGQGQALFGIGGHSSQRNTTGTVGTSAKDRRIELKIHWLNSKTKNEMPAAASSINVNEDILDEIPQEVQDEGSVESNLEAQNESENEAQ